MTAARIRLVVAATLFAAWLGWLGYLAFTASNPIILSHPQFLVADAWIVADLNGDPDKPDAKITVEEVVWSAEESADLAQGKKINVVSLDMCGPEQHWQKAGRYILPLTKSNDAGYRITPIPASPGYPPPRRKDDPPPTLRERLRIYPLTPQTRQQLEAMRETRAALP